MYNVSSGKAVKIEATTFSEINYKESDIEELLRKNIDMICDEEESMLIVGRQVRNAQHGISDLTAVDNKGNIVLIEIKRDRKDIESRKEAFEFQAIRYAAGYATIEDPEDLVNKIYAPYIERYRGEFESGFLTSVELGNRKLMEFLKTNGAESNFNQSQEIILVASDFDEQTLSAVAWLNSYTVNISCYKMIPYKIKDEVYI
ncbi:endonuclease NucS domain-containing protein [Sporosarcina sp. P34]|uniref:endonuclease NucS domain-containing protein n=1 Tax=Sporosarcina sp. P34 TaxID=2048247 RepID=UPI001E48066E|nr:endonuclease NucS domain-containing protein [Sporosarcina sp. P34]